MGESLELEEVVQIGGKDRVRRGTSQLQITGQVVDPVGVSSDTLLDRTISDFRRLTNRLQQIGEKCRHAPRARPIQIYRDERSGGASQIG
jgi:hypothetical protein